MSIARSCLVLFGLVACSHPQGGGGKHAAAAAAGEDKPYDGAALVSPIEVTAEEVAMAPGGDCLAKQLKFHLKDAKGTEASFAFGTITGMAEGGTPPGPLAASGGVYEDHGNSCGGLRQGYAVKAAGATLVADEDFSDEQGGDGKASHVIATFAAGATLTLK